MSILHPIRHIRMIMIPPCRECSYHSVDYVGICGGSHVCSCEKYLDRYEKLNCIRLKFALCEVVRGTRFCDFKMKELGDSND